MTPENKELVKNALDSYFYTLNDRQREAVYQITGPVLVLAGAGSGKTTAVINRAAMMVLFGDALNSDYDFDDDEKTFLKSFKPGKPISPEEFIKLRELISYNRIKPWQILTVTFTNKAAGELKTRLQLIAPGETDDVNAFTFHSCCMRILRREISRLGYDSNFTVYDSDDSLRVIKDCMDELDIDEKRVAAKVFQIHISSAKDGLVSPDEFAASSGSDWLVKTVSRVYSLYQKKLKCSNAVDFDDLICLTVKLFSDFPDVLEHFQNKWHYITVDEYQDTNFAQYRFAALLSDKYRNLCVVGDDDQSIYKFRGATVENILNFEKQFADTKVIKLEQNYRSTGNILGAANSVIKKNNLRKDKSLWTGKDIGAKVTIHCAPDAYNEAKFAATIIKDEVAKGAKFSDFAVLYRQNALSNSFETVFRSMNIPYKVIGGTRFYERKEIKDIMAYLKLLVNPLDIQSFKRIINEPKRGIGEQTIGLIEQASEDSNFSPIEVSRRAEEFSLLAKKAKELTKFAATFDYLREMSVIKPLPDFYDILLKKTGFEEHYKKQGVEGQTRLENILEMRSNLVGFMDECEKTGEEPTLATFTESISLFTDTDRYEDADDTVNMLTIHSAKGLEWKNVFIAGMEENIFPSYRSTEEQTELEEERRLAYVAITRAKERLYITHTTSRMLYGRTQYNTSSRFLREIDKACIEKEGETVKKLSETGPEYEKTAAYSLQSQLADRKEKKTGQNTEFKPGERIKHPKFGFGMVISAKEVGGDWLLEISFDTVGTKKIMAKYAKIEHFDGDV
jgi:DNA helicase-2/ATP-dependent DNA helicase PcrA